MMMISSCRGVLQTDRRTDERMDIGDCRVAFATEKLFEIIVVVIAFKLALTNHIQ